MGATFAPEGRSRRLGAIVWLPVLAVALLAGAPARSQPACEIPEAARSLWRCVNGFVIGPEDVIVRLPIPETDPEPLYQAGLEAARREDWRIAIAYFLAAHHRAHLVPRYMYNLGAAYARAGRNELAVAWLAAYLVAAPDAPNRDAVWGQINDLEERARSEADQLWGTAEQAAALIPRVGAEGGARYRAIILLAVLADYAGDFPRARRYFRSARLANTIDSRTDEGTDALMRRLLVQALIVDSDVSQAVPLADALASPPADESYRRRLQRLRFGGANLTPELSPVTPTFLDLFEDCACVIVRAAWTQDEDGLTRIAEARRNDPDPTVRVTALAAIGQPQEALDRLNQIESHDRELAASMVAEIMLLRGGRYDSAVRAREIAVQSVPSDSSGIWAARAGALLDASEGRTQDAITRLLAALSRRGATTRPRLVQPLGAGLVSWTPAGQWASARFDPAGLIAEYLVRSDVAAIAQEAELQLDTLRRLRFYETARLAPHFRLGGRDPDALRRDTLEIASGGDPALVERRAAIERALIVAYGLPGSIYDRARYLEYARAAGTTTEQVSGLGMAAQESARALRRIRAEYTRSGAAWGRRRN